MKVVFCKVFGLVSSLVLEEIVSLSLVKNEIFFDVYVVGVNFLDILIIEGKY